MKAFYETRSDPFFTGRMTRYPFPLHVHEIVELVVILRGSCVMQLDGTTYTLSAGDAAIAFPLSPHSFEEISEDTEGFAAFFPADTIAEFSNLFHTQLPEVPVLRNALNQKDVSFAITSMLNTPPEEASPYRLAYLHLLLAHILNAMDFRPAAECHERGLATKIVRYVYDHACENISISSTARDLGISESHLSHLFAQQFQVNFRRFINAIRIDKATMLMRDPYMTLTEISDACGFENMRTFRRAFSRETGSLPASYMKSLRSSRGRKPDGEPRLPVA